MDAAYNYFKKTALLFAIALLSAAPSFAHRLPQVPASVSSDRVSILRLSALTALLVLPLR